jgi:hypothetical protein
VLATIPVAWLPLELARAAWFGIAAGALAYACGVTYRLTALLSGGFWWAMTGANPLPLLVAGLWWPALRWLWVLKPNAALVLFARHPDRRAVAGAVGLLVASFIIWPTWFTSWLAGVLDPPFGHAYHPIPLTLPFGWLPLLALLRWRDPRARMLAAWTLVPSSVMPYELLLLFGIARTRREWLTLVAVSWVVVAYVYAVPTDPVFAVWAGRIWPAVLGGWMAGVVLVLSRAASPQTASRAGSRVLLPSSAPIPPYSGPRPPSYAPRSPAATRERA